MNQTSRYYAVTALKEKRTGPLAPQETHQQLSRQYLTGQIAYRFTALQPLHIGTGQLVPPDPALTIEIPLVKEFYRAGERLAAPGSSLKGAIRSLIEAVTFSCVNKTGDRKLPKRKYGECNYARFKKVCPACRLFGAMGYLGKTTIGDALLLPDSSRPAIRFIPPQFPPKGKRARRHYPHKLIDPRDPTWPLEVLPAGSQFAGTIHFRNLSEGELGLLFLAMGQGKPPLRLKMGGGKSSGLGAVRFEDLQLTLVDVAQNYLAYDAAANAAQSPAHYLEKATPLLDKEALRILEQDLSFSE